MRTASGFTLLELLIGMAIAGVLATISYSGYQAQIERSNFRTMKEFGMELAIKQQLHRQRYGRYAQEVNSNGHSSSNRLIVPGVSTYQVNIDRADFRSFRATIRPLNPEGFRMPEQCQTLLVHSDVGVQRFESLAAGGRNTSEQCVPHR